MTKLSKLHSRLMRLKRRRRNLRWGTGYSGLAVAVLWALIAAFLVDWLFETTVPQRVVLQAACAGVVAWAFRRYTLPWLGTRESELDVALMVERQAHIDTDLVAALQFESPEAPSWGSVELEEAVIEHTARISPRLEVTQGLPRKPLNHRAIALAATLLAAAAGAALFPDYVETFFNRMLFGSRHYPTRTVIESVRVNGREVAPGAKRHAVVEGREVTFEATCSGELPEEGRVELKLLAGGGSASIGLRPASPGAEPAEFAGTLQRLADPVRYQVFLGDAWTDPVELVLVPLPRIELFLDVTPPDYAVGPEVPSGEHAGLRQIAVVEGSRVRMRIAADKRLENAAVLIEGEAFGMRRLAEGGSAGEGDQWALEPAGTPLEAVLSPVHFAVRATDEHGLDLAAPVQGVVRTKADHAPRVTAGLRTRYILPTARPRVFYEAADDYRIARIAVVLQAVREDGTTQERETPVYPIAPGGKPARMKQGVTRLDLGPLKLVKGDQLRVTVKAVDYRGPREGKASFSEPLVFQVTDEAGILAAITEADRQLIDEYKEMIERQIDVGGPP